MEYIDVEHPISPLKGTIPLLRVWDADHSVSRGRESVHVVMSDYRQIKVGLQIIRHPF